MRRTSFYQKTLSAVAVVSLFAACTGQRGNSQPASSSKAPDLSSSVQAVNAATEVSERVESVYTPLDLENCEVLETDEESGGQSLRCDGYQGIPLYVTDESGRFDVDAGVPNTDWSTIARPYNSIGDTVEWRIQGGKPVAMILRYNFMTDGMYPVRTSELAVTSIGREGSPGCLIEWVEADAQPDQNTAARQIADQQAEGFDCDSSPTEPSNGGATAEAEKDKTAELTFASGASSATVTDTLAGFALHDYLVQASAGQRLKATLRSDGPALVIVIENDEYEPNAVRALPSTTAEALTNESGEQGGWIWEGVLPDNGVYRVRVAHSGPAANGGSVSPYSLTIEIE